MIKLDFENLPSMWNYLSGKYFLPVLKQKQIQICIFLEQPMHLANICETASLLHYFNHK